MLRMHPDAYRMRMRMRVRVADPRVGRESPVFEHDAQVVCANAKNIVIVPLQHRSALSGLVSAHALAPAAGAHSNGEWRLRTTSGM